MAVLGDVLQMESILRDGRKLSIFLSLEDEGNEFVNVRAALEDAKGIEREIGGAHVFTFISANMPVFVPYASSVVEDGLGLGVSSAIIGAVGSIVAACIRDEDSSGRFAIRSRIEANKQLMIELTTESVSTYLEKCHALDRKGLVTLQRDHDFFERMAEIIESDAKNLPDADYSFQRATVRRSLREITNAMERIVKQ